MVDGKFQIYGEDLVKLEDKQKKIEQELNKLRAQPLPLRHLNKKKIEQLAKDYEAIGYQVMSGREQVMANSTSAKMYKAERSRRDHEAEEIKKLKLEKVARADAGLPVAAKKEVQNTQKSGKEKAAEAMAYLAKRKAERQKAKEGAMPDAAFAKLEEEKKKKRQRQRDNEWEPE